MKWNMTWTWANVSGNTLKLFLLVYILYIRTQHNTKGRLLIELDKTALLNDKTMTKLNVSSDSKQDKLHIGDGKEI